MSRSSISNSSPSARPRSRKSTRRSRRRPNGALKGILGTYNEPLVSSDFNHDTRSSIFALNETKVIDGTFVRVMSWYDNEWGFSNRMSDTAVGDDEG